MKEEKMFSNIVKGVVAGVVAVLLGACNSSGTAAQEESTYITGLSSYVNDVRVEDTLVLNEPSMIRMLGLSDPDVKVQVMTQTGIVSVTPLQVSETDQNISFVVPPNTIEGNLSIVKGEEVLARIPYAVYKPFMPFISDVSPEIAKPGEAVTITGENLHEPLTVRSEDGTLDMNVSLSAGKVTFILPEQARSGKIYLHMDEADSNRLYLGVTRTIDVEVVLAEGVQIEASTIAFTQASVEYPVDETFKTTLPIGNALEYIFATIEQPDENFSMLYSAVILPDMKEPVVVDAYTTAVSLIFIGLGADERHLATEQWRILYDEVRNNSEVEAFANYIATLQKENFTAWAERTDATLKVKFQEALESVLQKHTVEKTGKRMQDLADSDRALVIIKQDPQSDRIYIDDKTSSGKLNNGSVNIVNDTGLYLSLEVRDKEKNEVIHSYEHIFGFMNMSQKGLIGPNSGGYLGLANTQVLNLSGQSANIEIISAGYKGETDKTEVADFLQTRTMIDNVAVPSVNIFLSMLAEKEIPKGENQYKYLMEGMSTIYGGTGFVTQLFTQVSTSNGDWYPILDKLFMMPLKNGISACFQVDGVRGSVCMKTLKGVSQMLGLDPDHAVETIAYAIASSLQKRALKRGVAIIPYVGWATAAAFFVYDNYQYIWMGSDVLTIGTTIADTKNMPVELNADIEFKLKIDEVKPLCLAVSPETTEMGLYVQGERFLLEDGTSPDLYIGGEKAKALDTVTETKVYGQFDAQKLIANGSEQQLVFLSYGDLFVEYEKFIQIVDQRDTGIYFNEIEPNRAFKGTAVTLKGCGWIPLDDIKVFFSKEDSVDGYVEADILSKEADTLTVKVPATAKSGMVYVTAGIKETAKRYFEVDPFSLSEPYDDEDKLIRKESFIWTGYALDKAEKIYFVDHSGSSLEGTIIRSDENSIEASVPDGLAYGKVHIYVEDATGIVSNEIVLPYVPSRVEADPSSKTFEESITITLTQEDNVDIYYRIDDGAEEKYTTPIVLHAEDAQYTYFSLVTWASVEVDGIAYRSDESEYQYTPGTSTGCASYEALVDGECKSIFEGYACPLVYDAALDDDTDSNWSIVFPLRDKDEDGIYEDYIYCGYTVYSEGHLYHETHHIDSEEILRIYYYESGAVKTISTNTIGNPDLNALGIEPRYEWYRETGELWGQAFYDTTGAFSYNEEYYISGERYRQYEWGGGPDIDSDVFSYFVNYRNGFWRQYYKNGVMQYELYLVNGIREGMMREWYESKNLKYEVLYAKGNKSGWETYYYDIEGQKSKETYYIDTFTINDMQTFWYKSGVKSQEIPWDHNIKNGIESRWYESDIKSQEIPWSDGKKNGTEKGWYETKVLKYEHPYVNDIREGIWREYYDQDPVQLSSETPYVNGKLDGLKRAWTESGVLTYEIPYSEGVIDGDAKYYDTETGDLIECKIYDDGVVIGSCMP